MTVGNFAPFLGTTASDFSFTNSFFAEDNNNRLLADNLDILYGLTGDDNLSVNADFTSNDVAILVGGLGDDQYLVPENSTTIIADNGLAGDSDTIFASGLSNNSSFVTIDSRHLYIFDEATDTYLLLLDYENAENQIELIEQEGGPLTFEEYTEVVDNELANNNGINITFEELQNSSDLPEAARLDLSAVGLSPSTIDEDIATIANTTIEFETNIATADDSAENGTDGSLDDSDSSYSFDGEEYFYDFYSLNPNIYDSGDLANISLISSDFSPALFVLDSRGNVLDSTFDRNDDGNSALAFQVGTGEPIFIAVESTDAGGLGDYNILFEQFNLDLAPEARETTSLDEQAIVRYDRIMAGETFAGALSTEDSTVNVDGNIFYQDDILLILEDAGVGDEIEVSLTSDFDGVLAVESLDDNSNLDFAISPSDLVAEGGTEQGSFTLATGTIYSIVVSSFDADVTGDYTLTTEVVGNSTAAEIEPEEIEPEENNTAENTVPVEATIQTTDSFTGAITTDDALRFTETDDIFYTDAIDLIGDTSGEVRVSLESDFDGVLIVGEVGEDNITEQIFQTDEEFIGATETDTFLFDPDRRYRIFVDTFEAEETGDYTITTELL